ncbi:MAG: CopG family transcriptional regulator [Deltaproteobacteria bacterium]|nr:MAG: CopG family transcriptional regulator [Deltaproteobacteria bacterium]
MITLRLDPALEQQVNLTAQNLGITRSEFVRKSIINYIQTQKDKSAWKIGQGLFGKYSSGQTNLSSDRKEIIKDRIMANRIDE